MRRTCSCVERFLSASHLELGVNELGNLATCGVESPNVRLEFQDYGVGVARQFRIPVRTCFVSPLPSSSQCTLTSEDMNNYTLSGQCNKSTSTPLI